MVRPIRLGQADFRRIREEGSYYVDKTGLVREVLDAPYTVLLLPRPRRFGKTLNQRMLQAFFDDQQSAAGLFRDLTVADDAEAMAHLNRYPTVFLTFKDLHVQDWQGFVDSLMLRISDMIGEFRERIWEVADIAQQAMIDDLHMRRASIADCEQALLLLTKLLFKVSGNKVVVLIDEYDHPIHHARAGGFQNEVLSFMRNFMGAALKDNPNLQRAVVTGILRIGKESIFSGLNNLGVYTVLERPFSRSFGFTEEEVTKLLSDCDRVNELAQVRDWFNGYRFGDTVIYNPWSILNVAAAADSPLQAYWINTSGNELVKELILAGKHFQLKDLEALLAGQSLHKVLEVNLALRDLTTESVWSLLLFSGYLTAREYDPASRAAELSIPNREILMFFQRIVLSWFGSAQKVSALMAHLIDGRMALFQSELNEILVTILSYHDTAGKQPERLYHVFILGLLVELRDRFRITSERPAGQGRADLVMLPNHGQDPGIVFEFKTADSAKTADLKRAAKHALRQAEEQDYAAVFRQERVERWLIVGLAFHGRKVAIDWQEGGGRASLMFPQVSPVEAESASPLIFISYSRKDVPWLERIQPYLKASLRQCRYTLWDDRGIEVGSHWFEELGAAIAAAQVAILLISVDFLASDFIEKQEVKPLLERAKRGELTVYLIPVRYADWSDQPFAVFQSVADPAKPLAGMTEHELDVVLTQIAKKLKAHLFSSPTTAEEARRSRQA